MRHRPSNNLDNLLCLVAETIFIVVLLCLDFDQLEAAHSINAPYLNIRAQWMTLFKMKALKPSVVLY